MDQARTICTATISGFVQALAGALPQYAANGVVDFSADPWWVSMTSYMKASLWLFAAIPSLPKLPFPDDGNVGRKLILDAHEVEALASTAGCREQVEVSRRGVLSWLSSPRNCAVCIQCALSNPVFSGGCTSLITPLIAMLRHLLRPSSPTSWIWSEEALGSVSSVLVQEEWWGCRVQRAFGAGDVSSGTWHTSHPPSHRKLT